LEPWSVPKPIKNQYKNTFETNLKTHYSNIDFWLHFGPQKPSKIMDFSNHWISKSLKSIKNRSRGLKIGFWDASWTRVFLKVGFGRVWGGFWKDFWWFLMIFGGS
jgi:hypothetical protein